MTPVEMLNYLSLQIKSVEEALMTANRTGSSVKVMECLEQVKPRVEYLKGYASAMKHAGMLNEETIDSLFAVFEGV